MSRKTLKKNSQVKRIRDSYYSKRLHTTKNGKDIYIWGIKKRERPKVCELCSKETKKLHYHHWDDKTPHLGLWLCWFCHGFAERFEASFLPKYLSLKSKIIKTESSKSENLEVKIEGKEGRVSLSDFVHKRVEV